MIPGSNILNTALRAIARQTFQYYATIGRTPQINGQYVTNYASPICMTGSAQPIPNDLNDKYGLDFQSNGYRFFVSRDVIDVDRDVAGDQIVFNGAYYQVLSITKWRQIDGWNEIVSIEVPAP